MVSEASESYDGTPIYKEIHNNTQVLQYHGPSIYEAFNPKPIDNGQRGL